jgi:hypothetical protein
MVSLGVAELLLSSFQRLDYNPPIRASITSLKAHLESTHRPCPLPKCGAPAWRLTWEALRPLSAYHHAALE